METEDSSIEFISRVPENQRNDTEKNEKHKTFVCENDTTSVDDDKPCGSDYKMLETKLKLAERKGISLSLIVFSLSF